MCVAEPLVSVVAPAHNEEGYLEDAVRRTVEGLRRRGSPFEVIVCENGSGDRTWALAEALDSRYQEVRALRLPHPDYGAALRTGFVAATGTFVVNFDVDLVDLDFLDQALALALSDPRVDVVVGTKRGAGAEDRRPLVRRWVTAAFALVMRFGFGLRASDTHGLKLLRRRELAGVVERCSASSDIFDTELVLRAERAGRRVAEVPVRVVEQRPARSSIAVRIPRTLLGLARLRLTLWQHG